MNTMGFNFHIPLPGPFSYSKRIGGGPKGPSTAEQIQQIRLEGAIRDLYCRDHLRVNNSIDWFLLVVGTLSAAVFAGWWAVLAGLVIGIILFLTHRARTRRRAAFGEQRLASGEGCHRCQLDGARLQEKEANRVLYRPLAPTGRHHK